MKTQLFRRAKTLKFILYILTTKNRQQFKIKMENIEKPSKIKTLI